MSDFRKLSDTMFASPQIAAADLADARDLGVTMVVCNRPDGEEDGQPSAEEIAAAAAAAGMQFRHIPVSGGGFAAPQVDATVAALAEADGAVLGYCRTGTRSTLLWSLAQASQGADPEDAAAAAARAGYDVSPVRPAMDMLAGKAGG